MSWRHQAACAGTPLTIWFPTHGQNRKALRQARRICGSCPVTTPCLDDALRVEPAGARYGIRAGTNPSQRDRIANRRRQETPR